MKKKEIVIVGILLVIALAGILGVTLWRKAYASKSTEAIGQWVGVVKDEEVILWFDSGIDGGYTVQGEYGQMTIEVKEGRWRVAEVECPNHICEQMGWDDGESFVPITCMPNHIYIGSETWVKSQIGVSYEP